MSARIPPVMLLLLACACAQGDSPASPEEEFVADLGANAGEINLADFDAPAEGEQEVPPRPTRARGDASFRVTNNGTSIDFSLYVRSITNVVQAHIHLAPRKVNGQVVVFLYPVTAPGGGPLNGIIARGTFTAADLIGPLTGLPLSDLIAAMRSGGAYINVHTNDGVGAINTGPGDFPGGEIRGQIRVRPISDGR